MQRYYRDFAGKLRELEIVVKSTFGTRIPVKHSFIVTSLSHSVKIENMHLSNIKSWRNTLVRIQCQSLTERFLIS